MADFDCTSLRQDTRYAAVEAAKRLYHKAIGKNGTVWLYADQPNSGDNIYSHQPKTTKANLAAQGFGGATLKFPLVDGTTYEATGPWHANAVAMYKDTGIDLRQTHLTQVIIGKSRDGQGGYSHGIIRDVFHKDDKPILGYFKRGDYLAAEIANRLGRVVVVSTFSSGGSCRKTVSPGFKVDKDEDKW